MYPLSGIQETPEIQYAGCMGLKKLGESGKAVPLVETIPENLKL